MGTSYANFDDYIQQYNGGTPPSADTPTDSIYTYARNSGFLDRALYGELTFHPTSKWQITGGVRVFWQDVSQWVRITIPDGGRSDVSWRPHCLLDTTAMIQPQVWFTHHPKLPHIERTGCS